MLNKKDISNNRIKYFYILLLSIILCPLLVLYSNKLLEKRTEGKILKQFDAKIKERFIGRHLLSFDEGVEKICKRGSEELNNYYITRIDETIGLDDEEENNGNESYYIGYLIDIVKGATGESEKEMTDNLMAYGKHLSGFISAFTIAILAIPGWFCCCCCCCYCNCCLCCCFKKPSC